MEKTRDRSGVYIVVILILIGIIVSESLSIKVMKENAYYEGYTAGKNDGYESAYGNAYNDILESYSVE